MINVLLSKIWLLEKKKIFFWIFYFISLSIKVNGNEIINDPRKHLNFDELQQYYLTIQNKHVDSKKQRYRYAPTTDGL